MGKLRVLISVVIFTLLVTSCSPAVVEEKLGSCSTEQGVTVKDHISKQINAIADGDWQRAYDYAAPSFKQVITLTEFKQVISKQYLFLIFNNGINFGECKNTDQGINQIVYIDFQGKKRTLSYDLTLTDKRLGVVAANEIEQKVEVAA